jgi:putative salt-induced outer membrane protein
MQSIPRYLPHVRKVLPLLAAPFLIAAADPQQPPPAEQRADAPIPPEIQAMINAALASGNDAEVAVIVKYAKKASPESADTVTKVVSDWTSDTAAKHRAKLEQAGVFQLWTGRFELGGYITTGNTHTKGLTAVGDIKREGLNWRQKFHLQVDYQEADRLATREHYLFDYEPNYKLNDRAYIYGQAQYESDRFLGYFDRYSASAGLGYSAIKSQRVKLDLEVGPAYRYTHFTDDTLEDGVAGRGSLDFAWKLTPALSLTQNASGYIERYNSTVTSTSALTAKLIGPLAASLSYNVQYESRPPLGSLSTDTTTRGSLVYTF